MISHYAFPEGKKSFLLSLRNYIDSIFLQPVSGNAKFSLDFDPSSVMFKSEDYDYSELTEEILLKNETFSEMLQKFIQGKDMSNADVYNAAGIDRRHFSKIISEEGYRPEKETCIALALALKLTLPEAEKLLNSAGFAFSHSSVRDIIIEYFFKREIYDKFALNEVLSDMLELPLKYI